VMEMSRELVSFCITAITIFGYGRGWGRRADALMKPILVEMPLTSFWFPLVSPALDLGHHFLLGCLHLSILWLLVP